MPDPTDDPRDFPDGWIRYRILPESDRFPGTRTSRMRRAIKALGRAYGIRVEGFSPPAAEDAARAEEVSPAEHEHSGRDPASA